MGETEDNIQYKRANKKVIASMAIGLMGLFILVSRAFVYRPWWSEFIARNIVGLSGIVGLVLGFVVLAKISKRLVVITLLILAFPFLFYLCSFLLLLLFRKSTPFRFLLGCNFYLTHACLVCALILPAISKWRSGLNGKFKEGTFANSGMVIGALLTIFWFAETCGPVSTALAMVCSHNLTRLGKAMLIYANDNQGHYPESNQWCDLMLKRNYVDRKHFYCPDVKFRWSRQVLPWPVPKNKKSYYAINPNCKLDSPEDIVLLFETKGGWNRSGGPELLTTENHKGDGFNVVFNDMRVKFVKADRLGELKWNIEEEKNTEAKAGDSVNFRRPSSDKELKYWLENIVWYHHFTNDEIRAATGLTNEEIDTALKKFNIRTDNKPEKMEDKLLVLPYPGGRHPRIGFLDGAIDPQRETKFSVFTPWDKNSYVVVDIPEAIWSNLGLTYLAHTHIDTIWTKQGIELQKLEWNRHPDGRLDIERKLPNGIAFGVKVRPTKEAVLMEMWLKNGTDKKLSDLRVQICLMTKMAAGFEQQTNDNKVLTNPYVACRDTDGKRWIITAMEGCHNPWANPDCPCFHSDPKFPDLEPGETRRLRGWLSFYEGTDVKAEFKRIEGTGWRN